MVYFFYNNNISRRIHKKLLSVFVFERGEGRLEKKWEGVILVVFFHDGLSFQER